MGEIPKSKFAQINQLLPWKERLIVGGIQIYATDHLEETVGIRQGWPGLDALLGSSQPHRSHLVLNQVLGWR